MSRIRLSELKKLVEQLSTGGGGGGALVPDWANFHQCTSGEINAAQTADNGFVPAGGPHLVRVDILFQAWPAGTEEAHAGQNHGAQVGIYDGAEAFFEFGPGIVFEPTLIYPIPTFVPYLPAGWGVYVTGNGYGINAMQTVPLVAAP
jgi:hypothetical protein